MQYRGIYTICRYIAECNTGGYKQSAGIQQHALQGDINNLQVYSSMQYRWI